MTKAEMLTKKEILNGLQAMNGLMKRTGEIRIGDSDIFRRVIAGAYQMLKPEEAEIEGDPGNGYWWVCPECHVHIKQGTRFCMSCGKEILWK